MMLLKKFRNIKKKIVTLFDILKLNKHKGNEWEFLEVYCLLLEPLANSLN